MIDIKRTRHRRWPNRLTLPNLVIAVAGCLALCVHPRGAAAQIGSARYSSIVVDIGSGRVLSSDSPDELRHPASLTKMMTLYMVFEALRDRRVTLDQPVPISAHAAAVEPSKLGLVPGGQLTVEQGILGLVTKSANDAASALGELLGGDEDRFAQMMTLRARALGMSNTTFRNASGLPDPDQYSTARDLALLARHLVQDFPVEYRYFSVPSFVYRGAVVPNHDHMLTTYPGADGLKTGYTKASGCNLVTSALHGDVRLVGVVLGANNNAERDVQMASLLDSGFADENAPPMTLDAQQDRAQQDRGRMVASRSLLARVPSLVASAEADTLPVPPRGRRHDVRDPAHDLGRDPGRDQDSRPQLARAQLAGWGVQLGSFSTQQAAEHAAVAARRGADGGALRIIPAGVKGRPMWRVQLTGLTQPQAQAACSASVRQHATCMLIRPDPQFASR